MTEDQHTHQDPTQQYHQPDQQQELERPGLEFEMHPVVRRGAAAGPALVLFGALRRRS
jgi:hypothetical protein